MARSPIKNGYQCLQTIAVIASVALIVVTAVLWVQHGDSSSEYDKAKKVVFTSIEGGCSMQLAWTGMRSSCTTGGGGMTSCNCLSERQYNVTLNQATAGPPGDAHLSEIISEWASSGSCSSDSITTDVDTTSSATSCWYATDAAAAADAGFPCGSPSCLKVSDPAVYVDGLKPDDSPMTVTVICVVVVVLSAVVICGPMMYARRVGIDPKSDDGDGGAEVAVYDRDWGALTDEQREAATTLGYTKKKWNDDADTPVSEKDWSDLTADEQKAATTIGYTQPVWDA